jgi:hypothetical protein
VPVSTSLFKKPVFGLRTYHTRKGTVRITPERVRAVVDKFKRMKDKGLTVPVCWGHQSSAYPVPKNLQELSDERNFLRSRFNATHIEDLQIDPQTGELIVLAPPPPGYKVDAAAGTLINERDGTQVYGVSAALDSWQDGDGERWEDALRHIALTPWPVAHETGGFTMQTEPRDSEVWLGAANLADEAPSPVISFPEPPTVDLVKDLVTLLTECGVHLPQDTTQENFQERLLVALSALKGHKAMKDQAKQQEEKLPAPAADRRLHEEIPPLVMSTEGVTDPRELRLIKSHNSLIGHLRQQHDSAQNRRRTLVGELAKRVNPVTGVPYLRPERVRELEASLGAVEFSVTADDELDAPKVPLDLALTLLDEALIDSTRLSMNSLREETPPEDRSNHQNQEKQGDHMAKRIGRTPVKQPTWS